MKVIVADDSALIREGVARLLADAGHEVSTTADATALMREVALTRPDAAIVDIKMPPTHTAEGLEAARRIRREHAGVAVMVLSQYLESSYAMRLIADAPSHVGYLLKDRVVEVDSLLDGLERVARGECVIDPTIVSRLMRRGTPGGVLAVLTPREREVLALIAEGRSNAAIAQRLGVSAKTLEGHIRQILQKLDIEESADDHRRVLAVLTYLRAARNAE
jgi:DNA-binding NarL/FixJ family response regulator